MSPASTGSVGASAAARTIAAPAESPITAEPNTAASAMNAGMPIASSRVTVLHSRQRSLRSTFRPVENSAITTASSVTCSSSVASCDRVQPAHAEGGQAGGADDAEPEVDQRGRERALMLVRERADGREHREPEERESDRPGVGEGEAGQLLGGVGHGRPVGLRAAAGRPAGGASGPVGTSGASREGVGSAGTAGVSGTTGWAGSAGWGISMVSGVCMPLALPAPVGVQTLQ